MVTESVLNPTTENASALPRGLLLHVGCGPVTPPEWVNLDASWNLLAARVPGLRRALLATRLISKSAAAHNWSNRIQYCDVTRGLPFKDGEASVVYASHVLEHLTRQQARFFVRQAHRVLAPGGVLRLVVPDLERLARLYLEQRANGGANGKAANDFMERMHTCLDYSNSAPPLKLYRKFLDTLSHKWMYDTSSLTEVMASAGFTQLKRCGYLESRVPMIAQVERPNRFEDGICVEGVR